MKIGASSQVKINLLGARRWEKISVDWVERKEKSGTELKTSLYFLLISAFFISVEPKTGTTADIA